MVLILFSLCIIFRISCAAFVTSGCIFSSAGISPYTERACVCENEPNPDAPFYVLYSNISHNPLFIDCNVAFSAAAAINHVKRQHEPQGFSYTDTTQSG